MPEIPYESPKRPNHESLNSCLLWLTVVCALGLGRCWTALRLAVRARQRDESQRKLDKLTQACRNNGWVMHWNGNGDLLIDDP